MPEHSGTTSQTPQEIVIFANNISIDWVAKTADYSLDLYLADCRKNGWPVWATPRCIYIFAAGDWS